MNQKMFPHVQPFFCHLPSWGNKVWTYNLQFIRKIQVVQSGFRAHHRTETVRTFTDPLTTADSGHISLLILLDLSATLDIISLLLTPLHHHLGVSGTASFWFEFHLWGKKKIVTVVPLQPQSIKKHLRVVYLDNFFVIIYTGSGYHDLRLHLKVHKFTRAFCLEVWESSKWLVVKPKAFLKKVGDIMDIAGRSIFPL